MGSICFYKHKVQVGIRALAPLRPWLHNLVQSKGFCLQELSIILCDDAYLLDKNLQYLGHDTLTDVITFDYAETPKDIEGEIYISIDRIKENARELQIDPSQELCRVMAHGTLHLMGYKDATPQEQDCMQEAENHALDMLFALYHPQGLV